MAEAGLSRSLGIRSLNRVPSGPREPFFSGSPSHARGVAHAVKRMRHSQPQAG